MKEFWTEKYHEDKPHRMLLYFWRLYNALIFPLLPNILRLFSLRIFGAKIDMKGVIYRSVRIHAPWNLIKRGEGCIGPGVVLYNKDMIEIEENVIISQHSYICTASHDVSSPVMKLVTKPIKIEKNSWIAAYSTILPGTTLHEACVVGCGAVVTHDVPPWKVVGGNPAQIIKDRILK